MRIFNRGYYKEFILPPECNIPEELKLILQNVWNRKYDDLYERGGNCSVETAFEDVLKVFGMPENTISHRRYVYMAYGIALATKSTIKNYFPKESRFEKVQNTVDSWINQGVQIPEDFADKLFPDMGEFGSYQATDEAYNILYALLKTLEPKIAYDAILDILYDAMTGDAISDFAAAMRDIFNWWIIEVVPSAYCLKLPPSFYSRDLQFLPLINYSEATVG